MPQSLRVSGRQGTLTPRSCACWSLPGLARSRPRCPGTAARTSGGLGARTRRRVSRTRGGGWFRSGRRHREPGRRRRRRRARPARSSARRLRRRPARRRSRARKRPPYTTPGRASFRCQRPDLPAGDDRAPATRTRPPTPHAEPPARREFRRLPVERAEPSGHKTNSDSEPDASRDLTVQHVVGLTAHYELERFPTPGCGNSFRGCHGRCHRPHQRVCRPTATELSGLELAGAPRSSQHSAALGDSAIRSRLYGPSVCSAWSAASSRAAMAGLPRLQISS